MSSLTAPALVILQQQLGNITARQLDDAGIGRTARRTLVRNDVLAPVHKSVYRVAGGAPTFASRLVALSLAHPAGFITGPTAGGYLELRRMPPASQIHLCLPHGHRIDVPTGVRVRQSTSITPFDTRVLPNGLVIASWPRLLFDLAADLRPQSLASVIEQVLHRGDATLDELADVARRLCHPHRKGSALFATTLMERGCRAPVESHPELVVMAALRERGVPVEPQHDDLALPNGQRIRIDLAVPSARWAVELDIHPSHLRLDGTTRDKRRDRQLHLIDWQVERVTELDLLDVDGLCDELAGLYRCRLTAVRATHLGPEGFERVVV